MEVHIFGATLSPCVANSVLRRTSSDNAKGSSPDVPAIVERNFYVNDALPSFSDGGSAIKTASTLVDISQRSRFRLITFMSNSKNMMSAIPVEKRALPDLSLNLDALPVGRGLGVRWFVQTDELGFETKNLTRPETKRGILSSVCLLHDPLGFVAPVALTARALIQDIWKAKLD